MNSAIMLRVPTVFTTSLVPWIENEWTICSSLLPSASKCCHESKDTLVHQPSPPFEKSFRSPTYPSVIATCGQLFWCGGGWEKKSCHRKNLEQIYTDRVLCTVEMRFVKDVQHHSKIKANLAGWLQGQLTTVDSEVSFQNNIRNIEHFFLKLSVAGK